VPLQAKLAVLDRRGRALLEALSGLYHASAQLVEPPAAMRRYGEHALDFESDAGLWRRYRKAVKGHAAIWGDLLESCGIDVAAVR
jgi:hypothetical protein